MARTPSMRPADFLSTRIEPLAPTSATRPTAPIGGGMGAGFGQMFSEVQGEVAAYIQNGDGGMADSGASSLNAEGALLRARANGLLSHAMSGAEESEDVEGVVP